MSHSLEYLIIAIYLLFLLGMGVILTRANRNVGDYIRGGAQGTWWLVGTSAFMASFSAYTFTANGSLAYESGPTPILIFVGIASGLLIASLWLARWLRQTRAMTSMDIVRERYGPEVEQFSLLFSLVTGPLAASIQLWAVAYFCSAVFGFPLVKMILVLGCVGVFYSSTGGRWAVMATDFLHGLVLVPLAILVAWLCLHRIGGPAAFFHALSEAHLASLIKPAHAFPTGKYSLEWVAAMFLISFFNEISFAQAPKYLSVKDGREASRSALLSMILILFGGVIFLLPPMTARLLYAHQVMSSSMASPSQAAYATAAMNVLPNGTMGILVIAMFSATLGNMDTGLNALTGVVVNNLFPAVRRRLALPPIAATRQIAVCKYVTLCLGAIIITFAWLWTTGHTNIFGAFTLFMTFVQLPLSFPFVLSLFIKKLPRWSYFFMVGCAMVPNALKALFGFHWEFQDIVLLIFASCTAGALFSMPFYSRSSREYRNRVEALFTRMRTPIDYAKEVRESRDAFQLRLLGRTALLAGLLLFLLLLVPNDTGGRLAVSFLGGFVAVVGALLLFAARRVAAVSPSTPIFDAEGVPIAERSQPGPRD